MENNVPQLCLDALDPEALLDREWLCSNGHGSYAMGSVAGANTRRYHGLLVAALAPPLGRTVLCAKVDECFECGADTVMLGANEFRDGTRYPWGAARLDSFRLDGARPFWTYQVPGGLLEKAIWMEHGRATTCLRYRAVGAGGRLRLALFATYRDYHHETHGSPQWRFTVHPLTAGAEVIAFAGAVPWRVIGPVGSRFTPEGAWWWGFLHRRERERGLDCVEDLYHIGTLEFPLTNGQAAVVTLTAEPGEDSPETAWERQQVRERELIRLAGAQEDPLLARLTLAADQFLVHRGNAPERQAGTILAGYPWFSDWGRDTMIALPGLTLATRRYAEARHILLTYARYLDRGMLPNRFPDGGSTPEYNTVDATLWLFQALGAYVDASGDWDLVATLFPALAEVISWHLNGTRYGIGADPQDGLLRAGETGTQLTWMDAKVGDWVVTPRHGKPVEINALWYNALCRMEEWARKLGAEKEKRTAAEYAALAARVYASFNARFWNAAQGCLFDLLAAPDDRPDASLRPNQLFALSLPHPVLMPQRFRSVLDLVERHLLTPYGIRTLDPRACGYQRCYAGDQWQRDGAYHQGTVWPWLLGAYADGRRRLGASPDAIRQLYAPLVEHLAAAGLGSISEVFDGDPPHNPGGCPAQAWSVAESLRVLRAESPPR